MAKRQPMTLDDKDLERLGAFVGAWASGKPEVRLRKRWKAGELHQMYGNGGNPRREVVRLGYLLTSAAAQPAIVDGWRVMRTRDLSERGHFYWLERADVVAKREAEAATEAGRQKKRERTRRSGNLGPPHGIELGLTATLVGNEPVTRPTGSTMRVLTYDVSSSHPTFQERVRIIMTVSRRDALNYSRCARFVVYEALKTIMEPAIAEAKERGEELNPGQTRTVAESLPTHARPGGA